MTTVARQIAEDLQKVREQKPLLHHITNFVVMNETANTTLCIGALPVMAHAKEEVAEMVQAAGALVLNIGTLTPELVESMLLAGKRANELNIPVILDPVGAGATGLRTESAHQLIRDLQVDIVRGNAAEVSILAGHKGEIKGVESVGGQDNLRQIATELALKQKGVVAITGREDVVSDGRKMGVVRNGHSMLGTVTGTGCMATTLIGAFAAVSRNYFRAAMGGLVAFGLAGERAAEISEGRPGTFHVALYDSLAALSPEDIISGCQAEVE